MKRGWLYLAAFVAVISLIFYLYLKYRVAPAIPFDKLELSTLDGETVAVSDFKGRKTVICFSASWCGSCINELQQLKKAKNHTMQDVEVLVISDESPERIRRFREKGEYPFTFLKMEGTFSSIGINSIPTTYLLNSKGEVKKHTVGTIHWTDPSTFHHLMKLIQ